MDFRLVIACAVPALAGCGSVGGARSAATSGPPTGHPPAHAPSAPSSFPHEPGLRDSLVVCDRCSHELLAAKREGILSALAALLDVFGSDISPSAAPVTFHLDSDATCGDAWQMQREMGFITGFSTYDKQGHGVVCLFDVEKRNRMLPFTPENARTRADQILPLHEAAHIWLGGRANYAVQEPLVKLVSFLVSGAIRDPCRTFRVPNRPDNLIAGLCDSGATLDQVPAICRAVSRAADAKGSSLTNNETAVVVSGVIGADVSAAFHASGLL